MRNTGALLYPPISSGRYLYDANALPLAEGGAGALRKLSTAWTGSAIKVRRSSDNTTQDIAFDGSGNLNTTALTTFCGAGDGFIVQWFDQTGNNNHQFSLTTANQYRICHNGVVDIDANGHPCAIAPDGVRGYISNAFAAYTGTSATASYVGAFAGTNQSLSPRGICLIPSISGRDDTHVDGAIMVARKQSESNWANFRGGVWRALNPGTPNNLNQIISRFDGTVAILSIDGTEVSSIGTSAAFNVGRVGVGGTGNTSTPFISVPNQRLSEWHVWFRPLGTAQIATLRANQQAYYLTSAVTTPTDPQGGDPTALGLVLKGRDDFSGGAVRPNEWVFYDFGKSTSRAGAWFKANCFVADLGGGDYVQRILSKKNPDIQTFSFDGFTYQREGGACYWTGPTNAAFQKAGFWRARYRWVPISAGANAGASLGHGFADLMWPNTNDSWPTHFEPDIMENFPTSANKVGGVSNWHYDTVSGSGRALPMPVSSTYAGAYEGSLLSADVTAQNYRVDWKQWHTVDYFLVYGEFHQVFIDGQSRGKLKHNKVTPGSTYVPSDPGGRPLRRTFQTEFFNVSNAAAANGTFALEIDFVEYYAAP